MRRPVVSALLAAALAAGTAVSIAAEPAQAASPAPHRSGLPAVYPVPHSMQARGPAVRLAGTVRLVTTATSDAAALAELKKVLADDGVATATESGSAPVYPGGATTIYVGGADENPASAAVLRRLGVTDAGALPAEGYVLASGVARGTPSIVLDGHDGTGTYYAVQTLRQLIERRGRTLVVPGVDVRDWPSMPVRGVIEGFYGTPWSDAQRLAQLDFDGAHKMNTYVYSPKNDPYLRDQWRDSYPADKLAAIKQLVDRAQADHVQFTYALSPGLSICYSSASDEQALVAKFQSLWDIGVRAFSVPFDDISYTTWNCAADKTKFGTGGGAAGAAQSYLLDEVQNDFIATHPGAQPLQMVPTEYYDVSESPYKDAIKADLDPAVVVGWTGVGVVAPTISGSQAAAAKKVYGHDILLWDNYPVNDYATDRLLLGPYVGRSADLTNNLYGITANPMIEPEASDIALFNVADYSWDSAAYDPSTSWQASLRELAGGNPAARRALAAFADLEYYSQIDPVQAPVLAGKISKFWTAWESGDTAAAEALDSYLRVVQSVPNTLAATMNDPEFVTETQPWLDSAGAWGSAARDAVRMLVDERSGHGAAALADRRQAEAAQAKAKSFTYSGLSGTVHVTVGDGVIDTFVSNALAENDRWLGLAGRHVTAITSLPTYQNYVPANMVDGDDSTYFWSSAAPSAGSYVGVDLGATQPISSVTIKAGDAASPGDYIAVGTLEYSVDGSHWTTINTYTNTPDISATVPAGTQARYVRLRATEADANWVKVHEFTVTGPENQQLTVTGTPPAAAGSSLAAAADGDVDTAYQAGAAPSTGDALTVTLPSPHALREVEVVGTGQAAVQAEVDGAWTTLGRLDESGFTELPAGDRTVSAVRLQWTAGSPAPSVAEVIPWYSSDAPAQLLATPATADTSAGTPTSLSAALSATQPQDVAGRLTASAPSGLTVTPDTSWVRLLRGSQRTIVLSAESAQPGTYPVTVTFTPDHGAAVSATVTVVVHPQVSSTDVALASQGAVATASSVEQDLPQFTPDHAIDGDPSTRWSSGYDDGAWLQVKFAQPQHLGKVVISWEAAHATDYTLQTSTDGTTWTTAATVTGSLGGTETEWIDQSNVSYLRMQGVKRATSFGYSIYELQAYPVASS